MSYKKFLKCWRFGLSTLKADKTTKNQQNNDTMFFFEQFDKYIYFTCFKKKDLFLGGRQRKQLNFILRASQKIDIPVSSLAVL